MIYFNLPAVKAGRLAFSNTAAGVGPLVGKPLFTMLHFKSTTIFDKVIYYPAQR